MILKIDIQVPDIQVVAEWLASFERRECTSAQHDAIVAQVLRQVVVQGAFTEGLNFIAGGPERQLTTPEVIAIFGGERSRQRKSLPARTKRPV